MALIAASYMLLCCFHAFSSPSHLPAHPGTSNPFPLASKLFSANLDIWSFGHLHSKRCSAEKQPSPVWALVRATVWVQNATPLTTRQLYYNRTARTWITSKVYDPPGFIRSCFKSLYRRPPGNVKGFCTTGTVRWSPRHQPPFCCTRSPSPSHLSGHPRMLYTAKQKLKSLRCIYPRIVAEGYLLEVAIQEVHHRQEGT